MGTSLRGTHFRVYILDKLGMPRAKSSWTESHDKVEEEVQGNRKPWTKEGPPGEGQGQ